MSRLKRGRSVWMAGALAAVLLSLASQSSAAPGWYAEVPPDGVSENVLRRTLALEFAELEVPPDPERPGDEGSRVSLHVRVSRVDDALLVEVWDRGELAGRRTISSGGHESAVGRRAALAAVELVRHLSASRHRALKKAERERELMKQVEDAAREEGRRRQLGGLARFDALWLPQGAWAVGPVVGAEFNRELPFRMHFDLGWLAGQVPLLNGAPLDGGSPTWSLIDFRLSGVWVWETAPQWTMEAGPQLAASILHFGGTTEVDGIDGQRDTWTARLGAELAVSREVSPQLRLRAALAGGMMLRRIPLSYGDQSERLGGAFLGLGLGMVVRP